MVLSKQIHLIENRRQLGRAGRCPDPTGNFRCDLEAWAWFWYDGQGNQGKKIKETEFNKLKNCRIDESQTIDLLRVNAFNLSQIVSGAAGVPCPAPARLSSADGFIMAAVGAYNIGRGLYAPRAEALPTDLIQALVAVESGYNASAYASDPMQVNVTGDWAPRKSQYGLTNGVAPGQFLGIVAGINWLVYKAYRYDGTGARVGFRGWDEAARHYNGGGDPNYMSKVGVARSRIRQGC